MQQRLANKHNYGEFIMNNDQSLKGKAGIIMQKLCEDKQSVKDIASISKFFGITVEQLNEFISSAVLFALRVCKK